MEKTDLKNFSETDYYDRYKNYSNDQILEILKNHKDYQEAAVKDAVKIGIERQLIYSEQDLLAPGFQQGKTYRFTLFPVITNTFHYQRLVGSIFRYLFVVSFLPLIYGFLKYSEGQTSEAYWGIALGAAWFLLCLYLKTTQRSIFFIPIFGLLLFLSVIGVLKIFMPGGLLTLDMVMLSIGLIVTVYLLLYLKILMKNRPDKI